MQAYSVLRVPSVKSRFLLFRLQHLQRPKRRPGLLLRFREWYHPCERSAEECAEATKPQYPSHTILSKVSRMVTEVTQCDG